MVEGLSPEKRFAKDEAGQTVLSALEVVYRRLSGFERSLLRLRLAQRQTVQAIAKHHQIKPYQADAHLKRLRRKLREQIALELKEVGHPEAEVDSLIVAGTSLLVARLASLLLKLEDVKA